MSPKAVEASVLLRCLVSAHLARREAVIVRRPSPRLGCQLPPGGGGRSVSFTAVFAAPSTW